METQYEKWDNSMVVASDANYTVGYVNNKPAEWDGDHQYLSIGNYYRPAQEGQTFSTGSEELEVEQGKWIVINI